MPLPSGLGGTGNLASLWPFAVHLAFTSLSQGCRAALHSFGSQVTSSVDLPSPMGWYRHSSSLQRPHHLEASGT